MYIYTQKRQGEADIWNCVDDTTIYEVIDKG